MGYPVAGVADCGCTGGYAGKGTQAAAFALVLFILLVIILKAC